KRIWHRHLHGEFAGVAGSWQYCESPLIDGDRLIITPGGKAATMVALAKDSGKELWRCALPVEHNQARHASVLGAGVGRGRQYVQLISGGLVGVANDGRFLWKYERLGPNTANIPTPVVFGDHVFASAGYGKGGALLKL